MAQLKELTDLVDLDIQDINSLSRTQRKTWKSVEERVKRTYNTPSLPAYLLYEYHFNNQSLPDLSSRLQVSYMALYRFVYKIGIPVKTKSQAISQANYSRRTLLGEKVKQEYGMSLHDYLLCEYHFNNKSARTLAAKLGRSHQGILNVMRNLGIPIKTRGQANQGKTYEEIYGLEKAKKIKRKISQARRLRK